jgi:hypothetical protein
MIIPIEKALETGLEMAAAQGAVLAAAGSLFIASAIRAAWQVRLGQSRLIGAKK